MGNIYGMDIKVTEANGVLKPVAIEINGVDSGTDCFRYEEGHSYYRKFANVVSHYAEGRPIFIESRYEAMPDEVQRLVGVQALREEHRKNREFYNRVSNIFGGRLDFDVDWVDDLFDYYIEKAANPYFDSEDSSYAYAARETGVPLFLYRKLEFGQDYIEFELTDGKRVKLRPDDIGVVRSTSTTLSKVPDRFARLFMNSRYAEAVLDSKPLMKYLERFHEPFGELFPISVVYGLGTNTIDLVIGFLECFQGDFIVKKRSLSFCGTGVSVLNTQDAIDQLKLRQKPKLDPKTFNAFVYYMRTCGRSHEWFDYLTMYEEFINSVPIENPRTGKAHDGCARVIVYSPDDSISTPIVLGSQWRLAPASLGIDADLNSLYRANLSRGAIATPITEAYAPLINDFAIKMARELEFSIILSKKTMRDALKVARTKRALEGGNSSNAREEELLRNVFWVNQFKNVDGSPDKDDADSQIVKRISDGFKRLNTGQEPAIL